MMHDQAHELRERFKRRKEGRSAKALAVISGKGGVGKSNFSLNFSLALSRKGKKVLLFDMDIGMGNIDILMGVSPAATIVDMLEEKREAREIIEEGPDGLSFIGGGSGLAEIFGMDPDKLDFFLTELDKLSYHYDYMIFDMGAGLSNDSMRFVFAAEEIILITTPEPTSITDAYAVMKYIVLHHQEASFHLLVNRVFSAKEGRQTGERFSNAIQTFLKKDIHMLGSIPDDRNLQKAVLRQMPFLLYNPRGPASMSITAIADEFLSSGNIGIHPSKQRFLTKLRNYFFERQG
ncbi:MinD/ParA family protein [Bacillus marinisedimentorum]|uniref:MinD/ParA family protein n=1 Tax=Bacillus marinisedimentorum TaxID=1821260 RepID=UPI000AC6D3B0|nr:MinD/ParA family protein [Bacillus marinisedimentorum]